MIFKQSNRDEAETVFITCRNVSAATVSAGSAVEWDVVESTDGNKVTSAKSASHAGLFAGITDAELIDDAYGLVQVYGYRASAWFSGHSGTASNPGTFLQPTAGRLEIQAGLSAATTSGHQYCSLMETFAAAAATSTVQSATVFIRAL